MAWADLLKPEVVIAVTTAVGAVIGGSIVAHHRTRGARRELAAEATRQAMSAINTTALRNEGIIKLPAELFLFYFRAVKFAEDNDDQTLPSSVDGIFERSVTQLRDQ